MNDAQRQEIIRLLEQGEELSPEWARLLFPPEKREYELVYYGKDRQEDVIAETLAVPLQKVRAFGQGKSSWDNRLVFGDNLQVMKSLLEQKKAGALCNADGTPGIRLCYIDPPFATKQEFRGSQEQKAYQDRVAGAEFLEFLRKRLILIHELLADDGTLYLHLDPKKAHYAKTLADEIFGEARFRNEIIWPCTNSHNETKQYGRIHQVIFFYTKSRDYVWNPQRGDFSDKQLKRYREDDNGDLYTCQDLTAERRNSNSGKFNWRGTFPSDGRGWGYERDQLEKWWAEGRIAMKRDGTPRQDGLIVYLKNAEGQTPQSIWSDIPRIANTSAERLDYPTQKPEALLERVIRTSSNEGDLVLDCFVGSGTAPAVAEKLGRRWIAIDCGKLSIYTVQKRMLRLRKNIGNKGAALTPKPFSLYNAGLYDFGKLRELPWDAWRFFALQLFQCRDARHRVGGIQLDGYLKGSSVLVFNHLSKPGIRIDEETVQSLHEAFGSKIGSRMYVVAPALVFDFQQDYLTLDGVRYYALRIPYSIIHELHQREFTALRQPVGEKEVNDLVDAVGFDFVRRPELEYKVGTKSLENSEAERAFIKIKAFKSEAAVRGPLGRLGNREALAMVMLDYNFDTESDIFAHDEVFYAEAIEKAEWTINFPVSHMGERIMAIFVDIYGNEAREVIPATKFGVDAVPKTAAAKPKAPPKVAAQATASKKKTETTSTTKKRPTPQKRAARKVKA